MNKLALLVILAVILRGAVGFCVAFAGLAHVTRLRALLAWAAKVPPRRGWFLAHAAAVAAFAALSTSVYGPSTNTMPT